MQRNIDDLGRLVIPKEMRKQLEINEGDPVNIECAGDKIIITNPSGIDYKQRIDKAIEYCNNNIEFTPRLIDVIDILRERDSNE